MLLSPSFSSKSFYNFPRQVPFSSCKHTDWGQGQSSFQTPLYQKLTLSAVCHPFPPGHYQSSTICQLIHLSHHTLSATGYQFSNCWTTLPPSKPNPLRGYSLPSFSSPHYFQNGFLTARSKLSVPGLQVAGTSEYLSEAQSTHLYHLYYFSEHINLLTSDFQFNSYC